MCSKKNRVALGTRMLLILTRRAAWSSQREKYPSFAWKDGGVETLIDIFWEETIQYSLESRFSVVFTVSLFPCKFLLTLR